MTPEAPTLDAALHGQAAQRTVDVAMADLDGIRRTLNHGAAGDALVAVALGTPHFSLAEFRTLDTLLDAFDGKPACDFYVNTSRFIL